MAALYREISSYESDISNHVGTTGSEVRLTGQCLEFLQVRLLHRICQREYESRTLARYISPNVSVWTFSITGWYKPSASFMDLLKQNPNRQFHVLNTCVSVDAERYREATVWATIRYHGMASEGPFTGLPIDMVTKFRWVRQEGKWTLVSVRTIRGFEPLA
jgi:hypothetical protein